MPESKSSREKKSGFFLKAGLFVLSTCLVLLFAELSVRALTDTPVPLFQNHPVLGKTYRPGFTGTRYVAESERWIDFRFNREGLRGGDLSYERLPQTVRVAVVGDSMIAAAAVDETETAVSVLQELLQDAYADFDWEVQNAGISGAGPGQELVLYREVISKYAPDIVVLAFYVGNDLVDSSRALTSSPHRIYFDLDEDGALFQLPHSQSRSTASRWLNEKSRFYVWWKDRTGKLKARFERASVGPPKGQFIFNSEPEGKILRAWMIVEKLIEAIRVEVEGDGAELAVALLPSAEQILDERWKATEAAAAALGITVDPDYPQKRFEAIGRRLGVPVIFMTDAFREATPHRSLEYEEEWLHFGGKYHFNVAGNRLAAQAIRDFLVETETGRDMVARATAP